MSFRLPFTCPWHNTRNQGFAPAEDGANQCDTALAKPSLLLLKGHCQAWYTKKKSYPPSLAHVNLNTELVLRERLKQTAVKIWCYFTRLFRLLLQISLWKYLQQSCLWGRSNLIIIHFLERCQHYRQYFVWGKRNSTITKVHTFRFIIIFLEEKKRSLKEH